MPSVRETEVSTITAASRSRGWSGAGEVGDILEGRPGQSMAIIRRNKCIQLRIIIIKRKKRKKRKKEKERCPSLASLHREPAAGDG